MKNFWSGFRGGIVPGIRNGLQIIGIITLVILLALTLAGCSSLRPDTLDLTFYGGQDRPEREDREWGVTRSTNYGASLTLGWTFGKETP